MLRTVTPIPPMVVKTRPVFDVTVDHFFEICQDNPDFRIDTEQKWRFDCDVTNGCRNEPQKR